MGFGLGIVELVSTGGGLVDFSKCLFFFFKEEKKKTSSLDSVREPLWRP